MGGHLPTECISTTEPVSLCGEDHEGERTHLLDTGDMSRDILDRDGVLHRQSVALALYACLVDEDTAVGVETYGHP